MWVWNILRKSSFTIDYRNREILFGPVEAMTFSAPFDTDTPVVTVRMSLRKQKRRLVVDTGGPDLMLFQSRGLDSTWFRDARDTECFRRQWNIPAQEGHDTEVYLGKELIGARVAYVVDDRKDDGDDFDGVLGMKGPQFRKIAFDFEHRRFYWEL